MFVYVNVVFVFMFSQACHVLLNLFNAIKPALFIVEINRSPEVKSYG